MEVVQLKNLLNLVYTIFPLPVDFKGRHSIQLCPDTGDVCLLVWVRKPDNTISWYDLIFGDSEVITEDVLKQLKT